MIQDDDSRTEEVKIMGMDGSKVLPCSLKVQESLAESSSPPSTDDIFNFLPAVKAPPPVDVAVRVKLVVNKQELKNMLDKKGMSLDGMVSLMRKEAGYCEREQECYGGGWRPVLDSIPEGSDLF
jgi:hypothetical protein